MNEKNLIKPEDLTPSERRESASRAGKASAAARRKKRDMKAKMKMLLELPCGEADWNEAAMMGVDAADIDNETAMLIGLWKEAKSGNVQAAREVRNIIGKDNSSEELALKKKELSLKEKQLSGDTAENDLVKSWIDAVTGGDGND